MVVVARENPTRVKVEVSDDATTTRLSVARAQAISASVVAAAAIFLPATNGELLPEGTGGTRRAVMTFSSKEQTDGKFIWITFTKN